MSLLLSALPLPHPLVSIPRGNHHEKCGFCPSRYLFIYAFTSIFLKREMWIMLNVLVCNVLFSPENDALLAILLCQYSDVHCPFSSTGMVSHTMDTDLLFWVTCSVLSGHGHKAFWRMGCPFPDLLALSD